MTASTYVFKRSILVSILASLLALGACTEIRLISDYDETTDQQVTKLQREVETLFTSLERNPTQPACGHASHDAFYAQATTDINLLIARNGIREKNHITNQQLALLKNSLQDLEALHELKGTTSCLGQNEIIALRSGFGSSFNAILKLELAKKRGDVGKNAD